ncbi:PPC domain-containing DNA-binding protein [Mucilaginibacter calamicampi]|uniref:PPC domain-containing DNA-binding protein n=1 Tax=Mucilaginibacter calamicampi TaxID=1302352 RepID=A0ABW2Z218_9SPHI
MKKLLPLVLLLLTAQLALAQQEEYVKPGQVIEKGKAPAMKYRLVNTNGNIKTYVIALFRGDDILSGMSDFAEKEGIKFAQFNGVGAISSGRLGSYDRDKQMYHIYTVKQQAEIVSFTGNIATFNGKPVVHVHMSVSQSDFTVRAGHLFNGIVWPTLEIMVTAYPDGVYKKKEDDTGFVLTDPELTH